MRIKPLLLGDIRFQFRYGFYGIYLVFSLVYIGVLYALPQAWRGDAALVMIYTDPAAMGMFFMGAIVLFEKSEHVLDSLAVSPAGALEYVLSKLLSIGTISTIVAFTIAASIGILHNPLLFLTSVFLSSCLFSAVGLIAACKIKTLNQFFLAVVPAEILATVPAVVWLFWLPSDILLLHPGVSMLMLCSGRGMALPAFASLLLWTGLFVWLAKNTVHKMLQSVGGVKL